MPIERITTTEAAKRLGVSDTTVRRMVRTGRLRGEESHRPQGRLLLILWDTTEQATSPDIEMTEPETSDQAAGETALLLARLEASEQILIEVRSHRDTLAEQLAEANRAQKELRVLLLRQHEDLARLLPAAPSMQTTAPDIQATVQAATSGNQTTSRRRWWRRFAASLLG